MMCDDQKGSLKTELLNVVSFVPNAGVTDGDVYAYVFGRRATGIDGQRWQRMSHSAASMRSH